MDITALGVSVIGFGLMYGGILMARQVDNKASASIFRIGGILLGFLLIPMLHMVLNSPVSSAEASGRYMLFIVIIGILVDLFVVKKRQN